MTTPAVNQSEIQSGNFPWTEQTIPPGTTTSGWIARYSRAIYRVRGASSSSPVRPDGSRAPKPWVHSWGTYLSFPKTLVVKYTYGTKKRIITLSGGYPIGVRRPAIGLKKVFDEMFAGVGLRWLGGGVTTNFPVAVEAEAVTRFRLAALAGVADLGTTLGELRQTANFVTDLCRGIESGVHRIADDLPAWYSPRRQLSAKEHRKQKAKRVAALLYGGRPAQRLKHESAKAYRRRLSKEKQILSDWLGVQFALKPLVSDLASAAEALNYWRFDRQLPMRLTVRKGAQAVWDDLEDRFQVQPVVGGPVLEERLQLAATIRCHYSGTFNVPPSSDRTLRQLGLANPIQVAWELVLFSWMVDYALGVGNWIKSMTSLDHMEWVEGSVSRLIKLQTARDGVIVVPVTAGVTSVSGGGNCLVECGRFQREVLTKTPMPAAMPVPKKQLGLTQMANSLAALAGLTDTRGLRI